MRKSILEDFADVDISIAIVWINILIEDEETTAIKASLIFQDGRVRQFHDPTQRLGRFIARGLGDTRKVAWDIYLFYDVDSEWGDQLPGLIAWVHQMKGWWMDHYHSGDDLVNQLHSFMSHLTW